MKKLQRIALFLLAGVLMTAAGGAGAWFVLRPQAPPDPAEALKPVSDKDAPKYVNLEKVIVMLRREGADAASHYMAIDLVFKTPHDQEKVTKEQLPMLRSVAVRALSGLSPAKAGAMSIDELAAQVDQAYDAAYVTEQRVKPFTAVMIGKLIIE